MVRWRGRPPRRPWEGRWAPWVPIGCAILALVALAVVLLLTVLAWLRPAA
mgnify:CR=1 FL=1